VRRLAIFGIVALTSAALATTGSSSAGGGQSKTLNIVGAYETRGESPTALPNFDDGAKLAVKDLEKQGWDVTYERIPASSTDVVSQEQAFTEAQRRNPDFWIGLSSSNVFLPVGPKVAATGLPTFATSSPVEGIKDGPSGGANIFLLRPLNDETYRSLLDYACKVLKVKKIGVSAVDTPFGALVDQVVRDEVSRYKRCRVAITQTNATDATNLTQQAMAFKDAGVDGIIAANFPIPMGALVNALRQDGVEVPFLGGASLNIAKDAGSIGSLRNLVVVDDCVPDFGQTKQARRFTKEYEAEYGYAPNYASAQVYDAFFMAAAAVEKVGHDRANLVKAMARTGYQGACERYRTDKNNVLAQSVTIYDYKANGSKRFLRTYKLVFIPSDELATTPTTAAP
jgi:branched-chain amino acid transport system substrate-binding protein